MPTAHRSDVRRRAIDPAARRPSARTTRCRELGRPRAGPVGRASACWSATGSISSSAPTPWLMLLWLVLGLVAGFRGVFRAVERADARPQRPRRTPVANPSMLRIERLNYVLGGILVIAAALTQPRADRARRRGRRRADLPQLLRPAPARHPSGPPRPPQGKTGDRAAADAAEDGRPHGRGRASRSCSCRSIRSRSRSVTRSSSCRSSSTRPTRRCDPPATPTRRSDDEHHG